MSPPNLMMVGILRLRVASKTAALRFSTLPKTASDKRARVLRFASNAPLKTSSAANNAVVSWRS